MTLELDTPTQTDAQPKPADGGAMDLRGLVTRNLNRERFQSQTWEGTFFDYLDVVQSDPRVCRNAFQRVFDMILSYGVEQTTVFKEEVTKYKFFGDPIDGGADGIFGLEGPLMQLVDFFKSAAQGYGTERRILLLHGPVGSSKSTIARLLKKGLESYSKTDAGKLYTFTWRIPAQFVGGSEGDADVIEPCPMHEDPLLLLPDEAKPAVLAAINGRNDDDHKVRLYGDVCPFCRKVFKDLVEHYDGDWAKVMDHVTVKRLILSETNRVGIGTFQPKDEKNQDSTELTGDINYRKIAEYGSDSDPRAFNFDGELNVANRGIVEFIEILKLDVAFLYDLLTASQERVIKPKKFAQTFIDEVILGHTNEPEYKRLQGNEMMEAFRDRTIKIDMPYNTRLDDEIRIYEKDFGRDKIRGMHVAPHTIEVAAMWALMTRLGRAEEERHHEAAKAQALQQQEHPRLHRGEHQGAARGGPARGHDRHQPAVHPGQDQQHARQPPGGFGEDDQPVHGDERAGERPDAPLAHQRRGAEKGVPRDAVGCPRGVRGHHQGRGPAGHFRRRGRDQAIGGELH